MSLPKTKSHVRGAPRSSAAPCDAPRGCSPPQPPAVAEHRSLLPSAEGRGTADFFCVVKVAKARRAAPSPSTCLPLPVKPSAARWPQAPGCSGDGSARRQRWLRLSVGTQRQVPALGWGGDMVSSLCWHPFGCCLQPAEHRGLAGCRCGVGAAPRCANGTGKEPRDPGGGTPRRDRRGCGSARRQQPRLGGVREEGSRAEKRETGEKAAASNSARVRIEKRSRWEALDGAPGGSILTKHDPAESTESARGGTGRRAAGAAQRALLAGHQGWEVLPWQRQPAPWIRPTAPSTPAVPWAPVRAPAETAPGAMLHHPAAGCLPCPYPTSNGQWQRRRGAATIRFTAHGHRRFHAHRRPSPLPRERPSEAASRPPRGWHRARTWPGSRGAAPVTDLPAVTAQGSEQPPRTSPGVDQGERRGHEPEVPASRVTAHSFR